MELNALNKFYQSVVGKCARHIIGLHISQLLGTDKDISILGVGYANPYLRRFFSLTDIIVSIVPPFIGAVRWPRLENNRCVYADEDHFPLQNNSMDIAVLVHALEFADSPWAMLAEVNRTLPVGGRVIVVVPNRAGVWARKSSQPFGDGRPYTKGQLQSLMKKSGFEIVGNKYKLFFPPFNFFAHSKIAVFLERWAGWILPENSGVIIGNFEKMAMQPVMIKTKTILTKNSELQGIVSTATEHNP